LKGDCFRPDTAPETNTARDSFPLEYKQARRHLQYSYILRGKCGLRAVHLLNSDNDACVVTGNFQRRRTVLGRTILLCKCSFERKAHGASANPADLQHAEIKLGFISKLKLAPS
jgi:hypothetical protein